MKYRVGMNVQGEVVWCFMDLGDEPQRTQRARRRLRRLRREYDAFDAVFEERDVKVDEKG